MGRAFERRKASIFKTAANNSKLYSKYSKQLYVAAKHGVPDPAANPVLRSLVEKAKKENVPSHVIDKAIQKAAGKGGEDFQPVRYEGFGPGRFVEMIIEQLTALGMIEPGALYEAPFTSLHAGGPDGLFGGRSEMIAGIFQAIEATRPV